MEWSSGALIAWFLTTVGCEGILEMASLLTNRSATVITALGYADHAGARVFTGELHGRLTSEPRGHEGFGYDPMFIPDGADKTFAEMTANEKDAVSMRKLAVYKLLGYLDG